MVVTKLKKSGKVWGKEKNVIRRKNVCKKWEKQDCSLKDIEIKGDKVLEKVEKLVEKDWEATEKNILKRKNERKPDDYKDINLDVMMSRISEQSKKNSGDNALIMKNLLYFIYIFIIVAILFFSAKWLFMSQNG